MSNGKIVKVEVKTPDLMVREIQSFIDNTRKLYRGKAESAYMSGYEYAANSISDLMEEASVARSRQQCLRFAGQVAERIRICNFDRLGQVVSEQLEELGQRWNVPCMALVLPEASGIGWRVFSQYHAHTAPELWQPGQRLGTELDLFDGSQPHQLRFANNPHLAPLQTIFGNADRFLLPHSREGVAKGF